MLLSVFLVFTLTACGGRVPIVNDDNDATEDTSSNSGDDNGSNASSSNWEEFYTSYAEAMGNASDEISNSISDENYLYGIDMMNFIAGDVTLAFTSSFFSGDEAVVEMVFAFLGSEDLDYEESGDTATITGKDSDGTFKYELKYDPSSASAILTTTTNGTVDEIMSICVDDDFYAKTHWTPDYGNTELIYYTNGDMFMSWDNAPAAAGDTLYKNVDLATESSFALSYANYLNITDGEMTGSSMAN